MKSLWVFLEKLLKEPLLLANLASLLGIVAALGTACVEGELNDQNEVHLFCVYFCSCNPFTGENGAWPRKRIIPDCFVGMRVSASKWKNG